MKHTTQQEFLQLLEHEAEYQSVINKKPLLPHQLDGLASLIATHSWQVISVLAVVSVLLVELIKWL